MVGVNTLTLAKGSPEDVQAEAIGKCRECGPHGYILAVGDVVPRGKSLANLQALVDVAKCLSSIMLNRVRIRLT